MAKLVLFDVDYTLLMCRGDRERPWKEMLSEVFGIKDAPAALRRREGKTEREIMFDIASEAGIDGDVVKRKLRQAYRVLKEKFSGTETVPLPGAKELLETLREADEIKAGVLTGNSEERGWMKLEKAGLRDYFRFGVFSGDAERREGLFRVALEKAGKAFGADFEPKDVWIIGDTLRDVSTASDNGARCIAVATGPFSKKELLAAGADFAVDGLSDYKRIVNIILGKEDRK